MVLRKTMRKRIIILAVLALLLPLTVLSGCGKKTTANTLTEGRPESATAYEAAGFAKPIAAKWQPDSWLIQMISSDSSGMNRDGKSKIWELYYFSPTPEENSQEMIIYNRGNIWPMAPGKNKGGDEGRSTYEKNKPPDFRVDSQEAYTVALRNGGGGFLDQHQDAKVDVTLRCKADYDAVGQEMPAPKYKWIWTVSYKTPGLAGDMLNVMVDGMNGDFITKEAKKVNE